MTSVSITDLRYFRIYVILFQMEYKSRRSVILTFLIIPIKVGMEISEMILLVDYLFGFDTSLALFTENVRLRSKKVHQINVTSCFYTEIIV